MTIRIRSALLSAAAAALLALPAAAQDTIPADTAAPRNGLRDGARSLQFDLPSYGGSVATGAFGVWQMVGARTNLGITLGISANVRDRDYDDAEQSDRGTYLQLGLAAKRYASTDGPVAPFALGRVFAYSSRLEREADVGFRDEQKILGGGVEGGLGVEWFPVRHLSVGGYTGVSVGGESLNGETERPNEPRREYDESGAFFRTFTSTLSVHLYF